MADTAYVRSLSRRELRERRLSRQEARRAQCQVFGALNALKRNGGVYEEPEVDLITAIPKQMLPSKKTASLTTPAICTIKEASSNPAYEADLKARHSGHVESTRPVVNADKPLPLRWEITHKGKNDNSAVQSTLGWVAGHGEAPAGLFKPPEEGNPRKEVAEKKDSEKAKRIELRKPLPNFEYKPKVTTLAAGEQPRVLSLVPPPNADARRPHTTSSLHAKPFR